MTFYAAIQAGFRKYADFTGRASRSEFWWWILFTFLVAMIVSAIPMPSFEFPDGAQVVVPAFTPVWQLAVLLPSLAVTVRRLRDAAVGWGLAFWLLLPVAGLIIVAALCAQPSRGYPAAQAPAEPVAER